MVFSCFVQRVENVRIANGTKGRRAMQKKLDKSHWLNPFFYNNWPHLVDRRRYN